MSRLRAEHGGIVTGWLVRVVVVLALFGLAAYEAGAILVAKVQADGLAGDAARDAALEYGRSRSLDGAREQAERITTIGGGELLDIRVSDDDALTVVVSKTAKTLIAHRIGAFENHTQARAEASAPVR